MVAHSVDLLSKFARFRKDGEFIDVRLKVGEEIFPAHRIVLVANSDYFHAMFTDGMKESNQEMIELKDESISPDALKIVMDSIYTGDLHVNEENVFEVLATADHLQVASVVKLCCDFLLIEFVQLRFDVQSYCRVWTIADRHGLKDLQEEAEHKMASMYKELSESEEFLSYMGGDELPSLLSRDYLSAPSETFVFKSVMQWIKHKKEERMAVAAKVIGAVRLGLVDIKIVIEELNTEEMQRVPEIIMHLKESLLHNNMPSPSSKFAVEKTKARSMRPILAAIHPIGYLQSGADSKETDTQEYNPSRPRTMVCYFDAETKIWKPMPSVVQLGEKTQSCFSTEVVGNYMYVAAQKQSGHCVYRYHIVNNTWETLPPFQNGYHQIDCLCSIDDYVYAISESNPPQRYSLANNKWQSSGAMLSFPDKRSGKDQLRTVTAVVLKSKIYVIHGYSRVEGKGLGMWVGKQALVHCFEPTKNKWEQKASTCHPHFGSSLFVVNNRLCVAGGSIDHINPAPVEIYNAENNTWSVVNQKHIPSNKLGAVEIEGRVYFIINKFPIDSGIRIPPGEHYLIYLNEWENLAKVGKAVLCYLPVKRENLKTGEGESKIKN